MSLATQLDSQLIARAHSGFEESLPRIDAAIRYQFRRRHVFHHQREDSFAEVRAATWVTWHSLIRRGKDPREVGVIAIVEFAYRGLRNGRTVGGNRTRGRGAGDLDHPRIRRTTGLKIVSFEDLSAKASTPWEDWLALSGRHFGPAEQASFHLDFQAWLESLPVRKRRAAELLAEGMNTGEVAETLRVSPAAISQDRQWLARSWHQFQAQVETIE